MADDTQKLLDEAMDETTEKTPSDDEAMDGKPVEEVPSDEAQSEAPSEEAHEEQVEAKTATQPAEETPKEAGKPSEEKPQTFTNVSDNAKWYIIHTYAGHENKVSGALRQRAETMGFQDAIFDIIVPTREVTKVSSGKKTHVKEKIFPGYVIVRMVLTDESWILVRTTPGVTAFIGAGNKPTPISQKEVEAIQKFMNVEEPLYKASFVVGEAVKIVDGPFSDFLGTIDNIDESKGKVRVLVSIFGRETPVELDFLQVSKI